MRQGQQQQRGVTILDASGQPIPQRFPRARGLSGGQGFYNGPAYDAADIYGRHMAAWRPYLWSPDAETNPYRDRIVSRVRDIVRNDGWAAGAVTRILDNVIGAALRPIPKPDYRFIAKYSGNAAFDHEWAKEFSHVIESNWRSWAYDLGRYCDASRNQNWAQLMRVAFRHKLVDGDALAVLEWLPERIGKGRARYASAIQLIDPDRLSNPQLRFDNQTMRGGVEVDNNGAAVGYFIREAHQGDWFAAQKSLTWKRVARETSWGRPIVVHDYDLDRATQHRGGAGIFTPILQRLKMLAKYDETELDSAIINAIFAAYVESPFDQDLITQAMDDNEPSPYLNGYQSGRADFHENNNIMVGSVRIPSLYPGEKLNTIAPTRPTSNFEYFEGAVLRNFASCVGLSAQQISNNWSDVNYSSARGALLEAWKTLERRRDEFAYRFAGPIRGAWLEESFDEDILPLPNNAPSYLECRTAYSRCKWMGPGRGWVDPVAERQGAVMAMDAALSTLEDECAQQGLDYEEVLQQRAYELKLFEELNIPAPQWAGQFTVAEVRKKPEPL